MGNIIRAKHHHAAENENQTGAMYDRSPEEESIAIPFLQKPPTLEQLLEKNPSASAQRLDSGIGYKHSSPDSQDPLLIYDLTLFRSEAHPKDEMAIHATLVSPKLRELLQHPLAETYLHLKWKMSEVPQRFIISFYLLLAIFFTWLTIIATKIVKHCEAANNSTAAALTNKTLMGPSSVTFTITVDWLKCMELEQQLDNVTLVRSTIKQCMDTESFAITSMFWATLGLSITLTALFVATETLQALNHRSGYWKNKFNYLDIGLIFCIIAYIIALFYNIHAAKYFGAIGVFLVWIDFTLVLGRLPNMGVYINMAMRFMRHLFSLLFVFSPILLGFAFAFHVLLPKHESFKGWMMSILRVLVMMTGEFGFEEKFNSDSIEGTEALLLARIFFVIFLFLTGITISNLIVGLTVIKMEDMLNKAEMVRLEKRVYQVISIENMLVKMHSYAKFLPKRVSNHFSQMTQLFPYLDNLKGNYSQDKICVPMPKLAHMNLLKENESFSFLRGIRKGSSYTAYVYDDEVGEATEEKLRIALPGSLVLKSLELCKRNGLLEEKQKEKRRVVDLRMYRAFIENQS